MATFQTFIRSIQADGNDGKAFERFVKWFLKNDPEWTTQVDQIWLWDDWPDKWGPDCGIDLVFTDKMGHTWAVQAKCYDASYYVTKKDIDSFLSESGRAIIDKCLLITSTDLMGRTAIRTCEQQQKAVTRYMLSDFEEAAVEYPTHISKHHRC